jgi:hypothetical protein
MLNPLKQAWDRVASRLKASAPTPLLRVLEVQDAAPYAGALFARKFGQPIPEVPRHFVLVFQAPGEEVRTLAYVHHTPFESGYLAGGLVADGNEFRRLDAQTQDEVMRRGGMAQWVMSESCARLQPCDAFYAYIGDDRSRDVNRRIGYRLVHPPYLHVFPSKGVPAQRLSALTSKVVALGPF